MFFSTTTYTTLLDLDIIYEEGINEILHSRWQEWLPPPFGRLRQSALMLRIYPLWAANTRKILK